MTGRRAILFCLGGAGCAELGRPPVAEPPGELSGFALADPVPAIVTRAAQDFDAGGAGLAGRPAATALAAARLEWLAVEAAPGGRLAALAPSYRFTLDRARDELRGALAIRADAPPEAAARALVAASRALSSSDRAAAERVLAPGPVFRAAEPGPLRRLAQPGPQPSAQIATAGIREEVSRLVSPSEGGGLQRAVPFDSPGQGLSTFGFIHDTLR